jgi:hypothetical protein
VDAILLTEPHNLIFKNYFKGLPYFLNLKFVGMAQKLYLKQALFSLLAKGIFVEKHFCGFFAVFHNF